MNKELHKQASGSSCALPRDPSRSSGKVAARKSDSSRPDATQFRASRADSANPSNDLVADAVASTLVQYGVRAGVSLIAKILRDPRVVESLSELVCDVIRQVRDQPASEISSQAPEPRHDLRVLVVGLSDRQIADFAREYRGLLSLRFHNGHDVTSDLRVALEEANVVISMDGSVVSDAERLIGQVAPDYLRERNGLAGLRVRLADLALGAKHRADRNSEHGNRSRSEEQL